jgi:tryptophan synthase alpha chain
VLFSYFNPLYHYGLERFAEHAAASGVDGVLCVDLPPEEAEVEWIPTMRQAEIDTVFLMAPTSPPERLNAICAASRGFVYFVSRTGVTGEREALADNLARDLKRGRKRCALPIAVGFGVTTPEQAQDAAALADGVVVGSALVRLVEEGGESEQLPGQVQNRVAQFVSALATSKRGWKRRLLGR